MGKKGKKSRFLSLAQECQHTSFHVLSDLRNLHQKINALRPIIDPNDFLSIVNRRSPIESLDLTDIDRDKDLFGVGELDAKNNHKKTLHNAREILKKYEDEEIPPPFWLRILPACLKLANNFITNPTSPKLEFISIAVEEIDNKTNSDNIFATDPDKSYCALVNSHKNIDAINFGSYKDSGKDIGVRVFAKMFYHLERYKSFSEYTNNSPIYWAIKLRSNFEEYSKKDNNWLDIVLANVEDTRKFPCALHEVCSPAEPFDQKDELILKKLVYEWIFGNNKDFDEKTFDETIKKSMPNKQVEGYCKALANRSSNHKKWPPNGIDTILCPAIYWAPDAESAGTAASIYWAFNGKLNHNQNTMLLLASQILLHGIGQMTKVRQLLDELREENKKLHKSREMLKLLQAPLASIDSSLKNIQNDVHELDIILNEPTVSLFRNHNLTRDFFNDSKELIIFGRHIKIQHQVDAYSSTDDVKYIFFDIICKFLNVTIKDDFKEFIEINGIDKYIKLILGTYGEKNETLDAILYRRVSGTMSQLRFALHYMRKQG